MTVFSVTERSGKWFLAGALAAALFVGFAPAEARSAGDEPAAAASDAAAPDDANSTAAAEEPAAMSVEPAAPAAAVNSIEPPLLSLDVRVRLSALHFLEFATWGAWWMVLGQYLEAMRDPGKTIGNIYATMSLAAIITPLFFATLADRYFPAQNVLGVLHLAGGVVLLVLAGVTGQRAFYWITLLYALLYTPTMSLANTITFSNVPNSLDFPLIRVFGTLGWIASNSSLKLLLKPGQPVNNRPILLAGGLSFCLALVSLWLPNTPPTPAPANAPTIPFFDAFGLLTEPSFLGFAAVSFVASMAMAFYFAFTAIYLEKNVHVRSDNVGPWMTLGQWVEVGVMFSLPWFLLEWGMKWVLVIGLAAWAIRFVFFAAARPFWLVMLGVALHGVCFDFFFGAGFMHVADSAPKAIAGSAKACSASSPMVSACTSAPSWRAGSINV